jgi:flagellin
MGINSNLNALFAQRNLAGTSRRQASSLQKLSSGFKINSAKDNPAGLVISEYLRSQLNGINQSVRNSQEAFNTLAIAEGGLEGSSSSLLRMRELALHALNTGVTGSNQISADQAELNGLVATVANAANTTNYAGNNLLNGANAITFGTNDPDALIDTAGTRISSVGDAVDSVNVQFAGGAVNQAERAYLESGPQAGGVLTADTTFTVQGENGAREFSFSAGTAVTDIATAVNDAADSTGVNAFAFNGDTQLRFVSEEFGADATVRVEQTEGDLFAAAGNTVQDTGQNATLNVQGQEVETEGLTARVSNAAFSGEIDFEEGDVANTTIAQTGYDQDTLTDATAARTAELTDVRGGMQLQLGEGAGTQNRDVFGLNPMDPSNLGRVELNGETFTLADLTSGGSASLATNPQAALRVIDQAIADVAGERARIGAYQANTLQRNINSLSVAAENVTATESAIRDTDFAEEITKFIREQLLTKVGVMSVQSANLNAENTLKLLGA